MERPETVTDEQLEYLDDLRESGAINMVGAGRYLLHEYDISPGDAKEVLKYWMATFPRESA